MPDLSARQKLTYAAHLFKALTKTRFKPLIPLIAQHVKADSVVIDVGANAGYFTKIFSSLTPQGKVYAFEPGGYARSILSKVVSIHGLKNVCLIPMGLSDKHAVNTLHMPVKSKGNLGFGLSHLGDDKSVDPRDTLTEEIKLTTLDEFFASEKINRVDLIKIDIEGWELRALEGGRNTIATHKPVLMLEMVDRFLTRAGDSSRKMWDFLKGHGYDIYRYDDKSGRTDFLEAPVDEGDILCLPAKKT